uniref:J domain-containing protein n=1 Tax=Anopheles quadriannulatus TaxID=34691 RepID=A0A182XB84_ANOQN
MLRTHLKRGTEKWLHLTNLRCRSKSAAGKQCWKCSSSDINNTFFCASCGVLRESAEKEDYFELLKLKKEFNIDTLKLVQNYRHIQSMIHPDKFAQKSEHEKAIALEWSSLINKAYKTLSKSIERGKYLLTLNGVTISEDNTSLDKEFLLAMMDLNESVEDAETADELKNIASNVSVNIEHLNSKLVQHFKANDLDGAKEAIIRLKYMNNIERTVKEKLLHLNLKQ